MCAVTMPNCSVDKGLKAVPIRGVSGSPPSTTLQQARCCKHGRRWTTATVSQVMTHRDQFAYKITGSTTSALVYLTDTVSRLLESQSSEYVPCVMIDFGEAQVTLASAVDWNTACMQSRRRHAMATESAESIQNNVADKQRARHTRRRDNDEDGYQPQHSEVNTPVIYPSISFHPAAGCRLLTPIHATQSCGIFVRFFRFNFRVMLLRYRYVRLMAWAVHLSTVVCL